METQVLGWTVDYGTGAKPVTIPHAWGQDVDVRWEGPAVYRTTLSIPKGEFRLRFHGVSYACEVLLNGTVALSHEGMWDAFDVPLKGLSGEVSVEVRVTKNGGPSYPVKKVLSGFLPYVYNTFGGIYRPVEVVRAGSPLVRKRDGSSRYHVNEESISYGNHAFFMRGILTWGWYPDLGHCTPPLSRIKKEIRHIKELGFNTVKFCLWVPPHEYLAELEREGMHAWMELPLWAPSDSLFHEKRIEEELIRIVEQYAHHPNIVTWTLGCELNNGPVEWRKRMVDKVVELTGCPLVKDNSGGAEMYGGDPTEFGHFYDFHPYGEAHFFPAVLDSLQVGPRERMPILLGETNDYDHHRDLPRLKRENPYWVSEEPKLNDQGVRWQYDIPHFLRKTRFASGASAHAKLAQRSHEKGVWIRKYIVEAMRARSDFNGYVLTGVADTPISTSGILDDWGEPRFPACEFCDWNADSVLFLIPRRDPQWTRGGNRIGYRDVFNYWAGEPIQIKIGVAGAPPIAGVQVRHNGKVIVEQEGPAALGGKLSPERGHVGVTIHLPGLEPGHGTIDCTGLGCRNQWKFFVHARPDFSDCHLLWADDRYDGVKFGKSGIEIAVGWRLELADVIRKGEPMVVLIDGEGGKAMPYWRESVTDVDRPFEQALAYCPDQSLDPEFLKALGKAEWLETRIDTRTYVETPYIARVGNAIFTTYRPHGGHGIQPHYAAGNPAGLALLREFITSLQSPSEHL